MRKLLALFIFAFAALAPAKDDFLQVSGLMLTNENSNDVRNDGTIKYDPATNTLTLDRVDIWTKNTSFISIVQSSENDGFVPTNPITIVLQHSNKITVDKDAEVDDNFIGIDYNNGVIITGDGCLEFTSHTTAMKTTSLELNGGCAVILKNGSWFDYGAKEEPTLIAQYLTVDNSALKVLASPDAPRSINSSMVSAQLNGVSSVPHRLIHEKKAYTVTKRNSSMSNSLAGQGALGVSYYLNHSSGGYYSTQTNYKYYDGWYYNDYVVSKDVSFEPLSINVYVNGQGVYKDNDVLPDGFLPLKSNGAVAEIVVPKMLLLLRCVFAQYLCPRDQIFLILQRHVFIPSFSLRRSAPAPSEREPNRTAKQRRSSPLREGAPAAGGWGST